MIQAFEIVGRQPLRLTAQGVPLCAESAS
jgi:hypothetical protein